MFTLVFLTQLVWPADLWQALLRAGDNRALNQIKVVVGEGPTVNRIVVSHMQADWIPQPHHERAAKLLPGAPVDVYKHRRDAGSPDIWHYIATTQGDLRCELHVQDQGGKTGKDSFTECDIEEEKVPKELVAKARAVLPGAAFTEIKYIPRDSGVVTYEFEMKDKNGKEAVVLFRTTGEESGRRMLFDETSVPPQVAEQVRRLVPGGQIGESFYKIMPGQADEIALRIQQGKVLHILRFTAAGELVRHSVELPVVMDVDLFRKPGYPDPTKGY